MFGSINAAILGTGSIAKKMAQTMKSQRKLKLYAVGSRNIDRAAAFARQYGFRRAYGSYEDLLSDKKVNLVYVATPHSEHYRNAKQALLSGKNVLVEKPMCVNEQQARDLVRIANEKHLLLAEAMWTRYLPFGAKLREILQSGVIGEPVSLTADVGWNIRSNPRMTDPNLAGGTLLDTGIYATNFASQMFGNDIYKVHACCSYTGQHLDEQDSISLIYRDGKVATLSATMVGCSSRQGIITGTKGYLVVDDIVNFRSCTVYSQDGKRLAFYKRPRQKTGYEYELRAVCRSIRENQTECFEMPHDETIRELHLLDTIRDQMGIVYPFEKEDRSSSSESMKSDAKTTDAASALEEEAKEALAAKEEEEERGQIASDIQAQEAIEGHVSVGDETDYTYGTAEAAAEEIGESYHLPSEDTLVHAAHEAMKEDERIRQEEKTGYAPEPVDTGDVTQYIKVPLGASGADSESVGKPSENPQETTGETNASPDEKAGSGAGQESRDNG